MSAARGGGAGLLLLAIYIFAMWQWNCEIERQKVRRELQEKIVAWVSQQPVKPGGYSWGDLAQARVVDQADADFLQDNSYQYQPIGPDSAPDSILFLERKDENHERYLHADGSIGYLRKWPSPDGRRVLIDAAGPPGSKTRRVRFLSAGRAEIAGEYSIDGYERTVIWNPGSNLVAINCGLEGTNDPLTIWHVDDKKSRLVPLPKDLTLDHLLSKEVPHADTNWGMDFIEARTWTSANQLSLRTQGTGSYVDPRTGKKMGFNLIYDVLLQVVPPDLCRIKATAKKHFAQSEFQ
ncbi:MAG: hypothetical protein WD278_02525 [Pirellulales bacterium]